jgi:branched-subunit amino acid aminotransferase/4-amino-4-deoxychorismate lyase
MVELNGRPAGPDELAALALTNYGHFTSMRVDDQRVKGLTLHMERLVRDCRAVFDAELDPERVRHLVRKAVGAAKGSFVTRVTIFDPALELGHPGATAEPHVLVTARPTADLPLPPLRVQSVRYRRDMPAVKHVGLFGALSHRRAAQLNGFDDALFTDENGLISEGGTWNVAFYDGEQVIWPHADVLAGVTMHLLKQAHGRTTTAPVRLADLPAMQAAFATNTSIGVRAISLIDDTTFAAEHSILDILRKEYSEASAEPL